MDSISYFTLSFSNLTHICNDFIESLMNSKLRQLDLRNNRIKQFSTSHSQAKKGVITLSKLWLGGNPVECGCDMVWMTAWLAWLANTTSPSGHRLVQDYKNLICASGTEIGTPVYKLDEIKMKCYPMKTPPWITIVSSSIGAIILILIATILLLHRHRRLVRWLVYKNFDKLLGDPDRNEDISKFPFDAFISFRYVFYNHSFTVILHP